MGREAVSAPSGVGLAAGGAGLDPLRIPSLDVLRGAAVLGILLINIPLFGLPSGAHLVPGGSSIGHFADFSAWTFSEVFVEGTMRAIFSMLFGASMLLMTGVVRAAPAQSDPAPQALDLYARRSLWLIGFGFVHAYLLLWPYDILYDYGLLGLLLLPFRILPARILFLTGLFMLAVLAVIAGVHDLASGRGSHLSAYGLSDQGAGTVHFTALPDGFADVTPPEDEIRLNAAQARIQDAIDTRRSGYWENFLDLAPDSASLQSEGFYKTNVFDIGGMMLIGMALLKWGILTGRRSGRFYWALLAAGYGVGLLVNGLETWASVVPPADGSRLVQWSEVTYDLGRLSTSIGHVAALMLLMRVRFLSFAARLLASAGRLALTNYVMQTVICNTLFLGVGLGLYGTLRLHQLMLVAALIWAVQITVSVNWLRYYRLGPLEWALRSLVRWSPQPMRRRGSHRASIPSLAAGT